MPHDCSPPRASPVAKALTVLPFSANPRFVLIRAGDSTGQLKAVVIKGTGFLNFALELGAVL